MTGDLIGFLGLLIIGYAIFRMRWRSMEHVPRTERNYFASDRSGRYQVIVALIVLVLALGYYLDSLRRESGEKSEA